MDWIPAETAETSAESAETIKERIIGVSKNLCELCARLCGLCEKIVRRTPIQGQFSKPLHEKTIYHQPSSLRPETAPDVQSILKILGKRRLLWNERKIIRKAIEKSQENLKKL